LLDERLLALHVYDTDRTPHIASSLFDYAGLRVDSTWSRRLDRIRAQLLGVAPSRLGAKDRLAWAINTYNFLAVDRIVRELAARPNGTLTSVRDVKDFFTAPAGTVEGTSYSLETFEHHFVFVDVDRREGRPLPAGFDPRAHFALAFGARGCPPLWPEAYRGDRIDAQLDSVTSDALRSPSHLRWDPVRRTLETSEIFNWYVFDFGGPAGVMEFVSRHAAAEVTKDLDAYRVAGSTGTIPWDWTLDQRP
ncbi:MAG TPA: DUF547 domain-containing protein, partial [Dongiaceae bacterium]|nr:DUF547 domain-containing protein [Dongiaceae bacterium]